MKFEIHTPCERLRPFVKHLVISEAEEAQSYSVLPDTALVMGFQYRGKLSYNDDTGEHALSTAGVTGLLDAHRTFKNSAGTGSVLVVFRETGVAHFIRQPVHELFGESTSLNNFFNRQSISELEERLAAAHTDEERIKLTEQFLINHLTQQPEDLLVGRALHYIHQSRGTMRISELALALYTSQSPLEKRFRRIVGASPKKFAGIVRARNMMNALEAGNQNLAEHLSAYYDQAHFIKDFKRFTSLTPEQYLKSKRRGN